MTKKIEASAYRQRDTKLRDDIIKLIRKHSKSQKSGKVLTGMRLKFKEHRGEANPFELLAVTMEWKFAKGPYKRKPNVKGKR